MSKNAHKITVVSKAKEETTGVLTYLLMYFELKSCLRWFQKQLIGFVLFSDIYPILSDPGISNLYSPEY